MNYWSTRKLEIEVSEEPYSTNWYVGFDFHPIAFLSIRNLSALVVARKV